MLLFKNIKPIQPSDCRIKCPLNGNYRTKNILYKCAASTSIEPDKVYLKVTERDFIQRFYNHKKSFNNSTYRNRTTLSKYVCYIKEKYNKTPESSIIKYSFIKFEYTQEVFAVSPQKIRNNILP